MTYTYFSGQAHDLGTVSALPQSSFKALVQEKLAAPVVLNLTWDEFHSMPKKVRDKKKKAPYLVPAVFKTSPSPRQKGQDAGVCNLLFLDIDNGQEAENLLSIQDLMEDQLNEFNYVLYHTISSKPDAPRLRFVLDVDELPTKYYRDAIHDIAGRLGVTNFDKASYNFALPMYLPTVLKDQSDTPIIVSKVSGRPYTKHDIYEDELEDVTIEELQDELPLEDLDYLKPQVEGVLVSDAASALRHIDPDCDYPEWLRILTALKHQFIGDEESLEAYELFDEWSSRGEKYGGSDETAAKWQSFKQTPSGRDPITIRTLFHEAAENGWDSDLVKNRLFENVERWIVRNAKAITNKDKGHISKRELIDKGLRQISKIPLATVTDDDMLLKVLSKTSEASITTLRKRLKSMRQERKAGTKKTTAPAWAQNFCYVASTNKFLKTTTRERFSPESLDFVLGSAFSKMVNDPKVLELGGATDVLGFSESSKPRDYLIKTLDIPCPYQEEYNPKKPNERFFRQEGKLFVNTYVSNYPEPDKKGAAKAEEFVMRHLEKLVGEKELRKVILDYMAYIVQYPGHKVRWALLLQGAPGCGKTTLSAIMEAVLGMGHVTQVDLKSVKGGWNEWAVGAQLVSLEEIHVAGQNRHEIMNAMKPLITNDKIPVSERFKNTATANNNTNYMLFTNHHDAIVIDENDRRYFVVKSRLQTKEQVRDAYPEGYFSDLYEQINENAAGIRYWLEHYTISDSFKPNGEAPVTRYMHELVGDTNEDQEFIKDIIVNSTNPLVCPDIVCLHTLTAMLETEGHSVHSRTLTTILRKLGLTKQGRPRSLNRSPIWAPRGGELEQIGLDEFLLTL